MSSIKDTLGDDPYPHAPGYTEQTTSRLAAGAMRETASVLRARVLAEIVAAPDGMTADEVATALQRSVLSIRPRVTELYKQGKIGRTGDRRTNASGMTAHVYRAAL